MGLLAAFLEGAGEVVRDTIDMSVESMGNHFNGFNEGQTGRLFDLGRAELANAFFNESGYTPYGEGQMSPSEIEPPAAPAQAIEPMQPEIQAPAMEMELG